MKTPMTPLTKRHRGRPAGHIRYAADGSIRWSLHGAARELNVHRERLARRQRVLGIEPSEDGYFSSKDIIAMVHSDKEAEQIRLIAAQRQRLEHQNREAEAEMIPTADVYVLTKLSCAYMRKIIQACPMTALEKEEIFAILDDFEATDWTAEARACAKKRR